MRVLIEIDDEVYKALNKYPCVYSDYTDEMYEAIRNGIPFVFLKCRTYKYVIYNVDWLKENWELEKVVMGLDKVRHTDKGCESCKYEDEPNLQVRV